MNNNIFENKAFDCLDHNIKKAFLSLNENMKLNRQMRRLQ